ncbi:hypothetical protein MLD38_034149 [Melastoma candidum]|uniref:Uncharacterized protein n=1 Tax=Melastoma candidum TaxID=119954 RepID=A0ACB9MAW4_9MYRT|nr:hypothetical protein MLD38_034149 [Melastoma candidum]
MNPGFCLLLLCALSIFFSSAAAAERAATPNGCNLFIGSWVREDAYLPLYQSSSCPFIGEGFDCQRNGRPDTDYLKYRWKPAECDLLRFDGRDFLERNRGKKILFVGDSLSNNMWRSLLCMIHAAVPDGNLSQPQDLFTYHVPAYVVSISRLKNPFLVDLKREKVGKVLKLDSITTGGKWKGMDVLIFNSYHWWNHRGRLQSWDYFQVGNETRKYMDRMEAYEIAMTTWAKWIDSNINPAKTAVFFLGVSAVHVNSMDWGGTAGGTCRGETQPVEGPSYPGPSVPGESIIRAVISKMQNPAHLLDITLLTQLRKDGHPSTFAGINLSDCSHWCLAGVPDTWNDILYTMLLDS